ncbi:hypothetical protein BYT27DRAFT_7225732 [Phlegmacium glaucopus]|nr:hypothetical protein BYT27DRAFT_7225732 [Phlegmacium glaucopus]
MATEALTSIISQSLKHLRLQKNQLPPALKPKTKNLYQILSRTPTGGVGTEVHQVRWSEKHISDSYWVITRSKFKCEGNHGKAWGRLYWKGVLVSPREELIRGALKFAWKDGRSKAKYVDVPS